MQVPPSTVHAHVAQLHKEAFAHGFRSVFGLETNIDVVKHHGSTDPLIVIKVLEFHGITKEQVRSQGKGD
jgi:phosphoglycolate phosphatase